MINICKYEVTVITEVASGEPAIREDHSLAAQKREISIENHIRRAFGGNKPLTVEVECLQSDYYGEDYEHQGDMFEEDWWDIYDVDGTDRGFRRRRWEDGSDSTFDYPPDDYNTDY